jgi:D-glycero-D-manno-heptose 1,7-bisphosphate phosphatase
MIEKYKLIIFDADGTLRRCTVKGQPCPNAEDQWELMPGVQEKMAKFDFGPNGILIGIASNQAGVSLGYLTEHTAYQLLKDLFVAVTDCWPTYGLLQVCPHPVNGGCDCRKPAPGMLLRIMRIAGVLQDRTLYVGDMESDEQAAQAAGVDFQWAKDFFGNAH